jgi:hypothetical protein
MVDSDDGSDIDGDGLHQESSESLLPLVLKSIWDFLGITLDNFADTNGNMIKGWRCGYCPIPGGLGAAPLFKYRNTTVSEIITTLKMERMKLLSFMTREALIVSMKRNKMIR